MKKLILGMTVAAATAALAGIESQNVVGYQNIAINPGFNLIAFNFQPLDGTENISIQNFIGNKNDLVAGAAPATADQIQVWDGSKFTAYFYRAYKATNPNKFTLGPAWVSVDALGTPTTDTISAGKGFWYARPSTSAAGTLVETSPLAVKE